ncbi:septum formation family protein [Natronosporangium hydrolyticum]|uniref:Septum formation family protein n=1 Tax=Natronosporangium hydrolyticum TaxID=2811111 RepID=A0A895YLS5_9ACTN|nr:septum formation family protein [Natronosporangium hydrolyticum]QSB15050.1 septum formation family protein [Natronosporangium hydrolyticum]
MRGRKTAAAVVGTGVMGLLLTGCSLPDGIDGDLTSSWSELAEPVGFVPDAAVCHDAEYDERGSLADYQPVDCADPHLTETVYVGEFTDSAGERTNPPSAGSSDWRSAYRSCDDGAADYLGADFRYARLWLGVTVPTEEAWAGGARWFRCEVASLEDRDRTRSGSLAGALSGDSELRLGCFEVGLGDDDQSIESMDPVPCDEPHHAEFVGVWEAPDVPYLDGREGDSAEQVHRGCREQVAEYVDVPVDGDLQFRTGTIADWMEEEDWDNGDRKFRCYLWLNGEELEDSLADGGDSALPVR